MTKNQDNHRAFKNAQNQANKIINTQKHQRKRAIFAQQTNPKAMWKTAKTETGQNNRQIPQLIKDGGQVLIKHLDIANVLNRQFLKDIKDKEREIPQSQDNPIKHYREKVGPIEQRLSLRHINISDLTKIIQ